MTSGTQQTFLKNQWSVWECAWERKRSLEILKSSTISFPTCTFYSSVWTVKNLVLFSVFLIYTKSCDKQTASVLNTTPFSQLIWWKLLGCEWEYTKHTATILFRDESWCWQPLCCKYTVYHASLSLFTVLQCLLFFHFIHLSDVLPSCSDRQVSVCSTVFCYECSNPLLYPQHIHDVSPQHFLTAFLLNRKTLEVLVAHPACVENVYFVGLVTSHIGSKLEFYYYSRVPLISHIISWLTNHYVSLTGSECKP